MIAGVYFSDPTLGLTAKYGINRSEFWAKPGLTLRMLAFNSARPLFRNNPKLRQAINFALDRQALQGTSGGPIASSLTDQYLPCRRPRLQRLEDLSAHPCEREEREGARTREPRGAERRSSARPTTRLQSRLRSSQRNSSH